MLNRSSKNLSAVWEHVLAGCFSTGAGEEGRTSFISDTQYSYCRERETEALTDQIQNMRKDMVYSIRFLISCQSTSFTTWTTRSSKPLFTAHEFDFHGSFIGMDDD